MSPWVRRARSSNIARRRPTTGRPINRSLVNMKKTIGLALVAAVLASAAPAFADWHHHHHHHCWWRHGHRVCR
jgi:hypothetical protein